MSYRNHINVSNSIDLNLHYFGTEACLPGHSWGPAIKEHFKIHYIHSGKGRFISNNKTYELKSGQGFLIYPNTISYYAADTEDPWHYSWIAFNGLSSESFINRAGMSMTHPIFTYDNDSAISNCLQQMLEIEDKQKSKDIQLHVLLLSFFSILFEQSDNGAWNEKSRRVKDSYVNRVIEFIQIHYSHKIYISDIARKVSVDPKYLSCVFKESMGIPIQEYLLNYRMNKACSLMENPKLNIGDISRSVGYDDPLLFSKMFKRKKNISPTQFREKLFSQKRLV